MVIPRQIFWCFLVAAGMVCPEPVAAYQAPPDWRLDLRLVDKPAGFLAPYEALPEAFPDTTAVRAALSLLVDALRADAYLGASVDSLHCADRACRADLFVGSRYAWAQLRPGNVGEAVLARAGFRPARFAERPFSFEELRELQEGILRFMENHGYPFARITLDSIRFTAEGIEAGLRLDRGQLIRMDTLRLTGPARVSRKYLEHYLGLSPGAPYDQERVRASRDRLRELPFLRPGGETELRFEDDRALLTLPLERQQASRFDFIIGVLPRSPTTGSMLITGSFEGELVNAFGRGERLYAQFEQLRPQTQELNLAVDYPYVFGLPLGVDMAFDLFKSDTTFLNLDLDLGFNYLFAGGNYLKAFWNRYRSTLLDVDEEALLEDPRLPDNLDMRRTTFGLEAYFQKLDYRFNPRRGWWLRLRVGAGSKRIIRNAQIEDLELGYLYDSLQERSLQLGLEPDLAYFVPVFRRSTIKLGLRGGFLLARSAIYRNEQYRLGGNRLLRGFDEESLFATHFAVATAEYRMLIDRNAYLYTFLDAAWLADEVAGQRTAYWPLGFGAGISFETRVGLFGVSLAFGTLGEAPPDFARPKIHFGYISLF